MVSPVHLLFQQNSNFWSSKIDPVFQGSTNSYDSIMESYNVPFNLEIRKVNKRINIINRKEMCG